MIPPAQPVPHHKSHLPSHDSLLLWKPFLHSSSASRCWTEGGRVAAAAAGPWLTPCCHAQPAPHHGFPLEIPCWGSFSSPAWPLTSCILQSRRLHLPAHTPGSSRALAAPQCIPLGQVTEPALNQWHFQQRQRQNSPIRQTAAHSGFKFCLGGKCVKHTEMY